ncbi:hypothetical protein EVAR_96539_1 [Eumeta japonica]|uniref:Uncharacterized protein n=1 Tax=Eumeta variegata TaxID=151549 RepID=A0A4C1WDP9_EUMVA|nr:hypothetical protein EVAR_96539_1 [Eumeta japonica]
MADAGRSTKARRITSSHFTLQRTKFYRSGLPANEAMRGSSAPRPFLLLPRVPISHHCDAFVTNFAAAEFCTLNNDFCSIVKSALKLTVKDYIGVVWHRLPKVVPASVFIHLKIELYHC